MREKLDNIKNIAQRCLKCKKPLCKEYCPLHNNIPVILNYINNDQIVEAKKELLKTTNMSFICSKLCDHEKSCYGHCALRNTSDGSIAFYEVENYLSTLISERDYEKISNNKIKSKIAVIGAGVSGMNVAIELAKLGLGVTLFDKNNQIGGVITDSLPNFRFNDNVVNTLVAILKKLNVEMVFNKEFGNNLNFNDLNDFDYIVFATGTMLSKKIFEDNAYVYDGIKLLEDGKNNIQKINNANSLVIGAGNVAMDVSRLLVRSDNKVNIVYRRNIANSPASKKEIEMAINDGVNFIELRSPKQLVFDKANKLIGLEVEITELMKDDNSTRLSFKSTGECETIPCDIVVEALGTNANYDYLKSFIPDLFDEKGWPNSKIYKYKNQKVLLTGDYLTGASSFAGAVATSNKTIELIKEDIWK